MNRGSAAEALIRDTYGRRASMRPRFMNRGSAAGRLPYLHRHLRFNEAPIHESGKFSKSFQTFLIVSLQ